MIVESTELDSVKLIKPVVHGDARGYFTEAWHQQRYAEHGLDLCFVQSNVSRSRRGVLRGLHVQMPSPQGKLVYVLEGEVFDVAVDVRPDSAQFGQWTARTLSADNHHQLYIPPGLAHGFCVTSEVALFCYLCTSLYDPAGELSIRHDDPDIGIDWPIDAPALSQKDQAARCLRDIASTDLPRIGA